MPALQRSQGNGPDDKATDNFAARITIQGPSVIADLRALAVGGGGGGGGRGRPTRREAKRETQLHWDDVKDLKFFPSISPPKHAPLHPHFSQGNVRLTGLSQIRTAIFRGVCVAALLDGDADAFESFHMMLRN